MPLFFFRVQVSYSPLTNASTNQDWSSYRYRAFDKSRRLSLWKAKRKTGCTCHMCFESPTKAYYIRFDPNIYRLYDTMLSSSIDVANKADWSKALLMGIILQRAV